MCATQCVVLRRERGWRKGREFWKNQNSEYCEKWERSCGIFTKGKSSTVHFNYNKSNAHMQDKERLAMKLSNRKESKNTKDGEYRERNKG